MCKCAHTHPSKPPLGCLFFPGSAEPGNQAWGTSLTVWMAPFEPAILGSSDNLFLPGIM